MNQISKRFAAIKAAGKKAFIPYIMGGDPNLATTQKLISMLAQQGADLIEVGVPFSDPLADGPTIQAAAIRSLAAGCTTDKLLGAIQEVSSTVATPIVLMVYYNMIYRQGIESFLEKAAAAQVAGLIIPDLPLEEAQAVQTVATGLNLGINFLVAPTSPPERIRKVAAATTGFVYAVSLKGVTGVRAELPPELPEFVGRVKAAAGAHPVAVGFGIATPKQAKEVAALADGVIVGSALVKAVQNDLSLQEAGELIKSMRQALDGL